MKPYPALARAWDLPEFAGQNAVNGTLHTLTWVHVQQIEQAFQFLFEQNSLALRQSREAPLGVDIDTKGLPVWPRSRRFEWAERGSFPADEIRKACSSRRLSLAPAFAKSWADIWLPGMHT